MSTTEQDIEQAKDVYSTHVIVDHGPGRWLMKRADGCGNFWTEVIVGEAGTVIVHGDGPNMVFRSWGRRTYAHRLIGWVGNSNLGYIAEKIVCGEWSVYDEDQARQDVCDSLENYAEGSEIRRELVDLLTKDFYHSSTWANDAALHGRLFEIDCNGEWNVGHRPAWNLIAACAACSRLAELLDEQRLDEAQKVKST